MAARMQGIFETGIFLGGGAFGKYEVNIVVYLKFPISP